MSELKIINDFIAEHDVIGIYALFSGGHDSLTATHLASQHPGFSGVIHIDTGTGLPETRQFVIDTCRRYEWPLIIKRPPNSYESYIIQFGFPGPPAHKYMYVRLKERALEAVTRQIKSDCAKNNGGVSRTAKIILISGVRSLESDRRADIMPEPFFRGSKAFLPIIADWTATDCSNYIADNGIQRSPVKDRLHMSGECFCGAYKKPTEFLEIQEWFPAQAERIGHWERLVKQAREVQIWEYENGIREDIPIAEWACQWGTTRDYNNEQMPLFPMCQMCRGS